ncbi:MAG TPA: hypothetical protein VGI81_04530 [Tepidisphaeraceae bacterium]|jgi:hypothetical protein
MTVYRQMAIVPLLFVLLAGAAAAPTTSPATAPAADVEMGKKLGRKLPVVNLNGVSLGHFLDFVRDAGGVNVIVNWRELAHEKVSERRAVNFAGRDVEVGQMLRKVLDSTGSKISFDAKEGAVYVTSRLDLFARAGDVRVKGDESDASARVNEALDKTVQDVHLESVRLRAAFELVEESLQVPVEVDWRALEEAGVADDEPITLHLRKPTGAQVLYWTIRLLPQKAPVVFTVREGKVVVMKGAARKPEGGGDTARGR